MTTLDLRTAPRDPAGRLLVGRGSSSQDGSRHVTFSREISLDERIYRIVWQSNGAVSRADIARGLGLVKASWLNAKIEALVNRGLLTRTHRLQPNGVVKYLYTTNANGD